MVLLNYPKMVLMTKNKKDKKILLMRRIGDNDIDSIDVGYYNSFNYLLKLNVLPHCCAFFQNYRIKKVVCCSSG